MVNVASVRRYLYSPRTYGSIAAYVRGNGADDVYVCDVVCEDVYVRS